MTSDNLAPYNQDYELQRAMCNNCNTHLSVLVQQKEGDHTGGHQSGAVCYI